MPTQNDARPVAPPELKTMWQVDTAACRLSVRAVTAIDAAAIALIALHNAGLDTGPRVKVSQRFDRQQIFEHLRHRPPTTPADRPTLVLRDKSEPRP